MNDGNDGALHGGRNGLRSLYFLKIMTVYRKLKVNGAADFSDGPETETVDVVPETAATGKYKCTASIVIPPSDSPIQTEDSAEFDVKWLCKFFEQFRSLSVRNFWGLRPIWKSTKVGGYKCAYNGYIDDSSSSARKLLTNLTKLFDE